MKNPKDHCVYNKVAEGKQITVESADWAVEDNGKILASISQIPLRHAWAITVHKSQGMSLDSAVIDLYPGCAIQQIRVQQTLREQPCRAHRPDRVGAGRPDADLEKVENTDSHGRLRLSPQPVDNVVHKRCGVFASHCHAMDFPGLPQIEASRENPVLHHIQSRPSRSCTTCTWVNSCCEVISSQRACPPGPK